MTDKLHDRIERLTDQLAKAKALEMLRAEKAHAQTKAAQRKADTRRKIELGGLVLKAASEGQCDALTNDRALLFGALTHIAGTLGKNPTYADVFRQRGEAALAKKPKSGVLGG